MGDNLQPIGAKFGSVKVKKRNGKRVREGQRKEENGFILVKKRYDEVGLNF